MEISKPENLLNSSLSQELINNNQNLISNSSYNQSSNNIIISDSQEEPTLNNSIFTDSILSDNLNSNSNKKQKIKTKIINENNFQKNQKKFSFNYSRIKNLIKLNLSVHNTFPLEFQIKQVNDIIYNENKRIVAKFKDHLILNDPADFIRCYYEYIDSADVITQWGEFFKEDNLITLTPNYAIFDWKNLFLKNIQKKIKLREKLINIKNENLLNFEENKNNFLKNPENNKENYIDINNINIKENSFCKKKKILDFTKIFDSNIFESLLLLNNEDINMNNSNLTHEIIDTSNNDCTLYLDYSNSNYMKNKEYKTINNSRYVDLLYNNEEINPVVLNSEISEILLTDNFKFFFEKEDFYFSEFLKKDEFLLEGEKIKNNFSEINLKVNKSLNAEKFENFKSFNLVEYKNIRNKFKSQGKYSDFQNRDFILKKEQKFYKNFQNSQAKFFPLKRNISTYNKINNFPKYNKKKLQKSKNISDNTNYNNKYRKILNKYSIPSEDITKKLLKKTLSYYIKSNYLISSFTSTLKEKNEVNNQLSFYDFQNNYSSSLGEVFQNISCNCNNSGIQNNYSIGEKGEIPILNKPNHKSREDSKYIINNDLKDNIMNKSNLKHTQSLKKFEIKEKKIYQNDLIEKNEFIFQNINLENKKKFTINNDVYIKNNYNYFDNLILYKKKQHNQEKIFNFNISKSLSNNSLNKSFINNNKFEILDFNNNKKNISFFKEEKNLEKYNNSPLKIKKKFHKKNFKKNNSKFNFFISKPSNPYKSRSLAKSKSSIDISKVSVGNKKQIKEIRQNSYKNYENKEKKNLCKNFSGELYKINNNKIKEKNQIINYVDYFKLKFSDRKKNSFDNVNKNQQNSIISGQENSYSKNLQNISFSNYSNKTISYNQKFVKNLKQKKKHEKNFSLDNKNINYLIDIPGKTLLVNEKNKFSIKGNYEKNKNLKNNNNNINNKSKIISEKKYYLNDIYIKNQEIIKNDNINNNNKYIFTINSKKFQDEENEENYQKIEDKKYNPNIFNNTNEMDIIHLNTIEKEMFLGENSYKMINAENIKHENSEIYLSSKENNYLDSSKSRDYKSNYLPVNEEPFDKTIKIPVSKNNNNFPIKIFNNKQIQTKSNLKNQSFSKKNNNSLKKIISPKILNLKKNSKQKYFNFPKQTKFHKQLNNNLKENHIYQDHIISYLDDNIKNISTKPEISKFNIVLSDSFLPKNSSKEKQENSFSEIKINKNPKQKINNINNIKKIDLIKKNFEKYFTNSKKKENNSNITKNNFLTKKISLKNISIKNKQIIKPDNFPINLIKDDEKNNINTIYDISCIEKNNYNSSSFKNSNVIKFPQTSLTKNKQEKINIQNFNCFSNRNKDLKFLNSTMENNLNNLVDYPNTAKSNNFNNNFNKNIFTLLKKQTDSKISNDIMQKKTNCINLKYGKNKINNLQHNNFKYFQLFKKSKSIVANNNIKSKILQEKKLKFYNNEIFSDEGVNIIRPPYEIQGNSREYEDSMNYSYNDRIPKNYINFSANDREEKEVNFSNLSNEYEDKTKENSGFNLKNNEFGNLNKTSEFFSNRIGINENYISNKENKLSNLEKKKNYGKLNDFHKIVKKYNIQTQGKSGDNEKSFETIVNDYTNQEEILRYLELNNKNNYKEKDFVFINNEEKRNNINNIKINKIIHVNQNFNYNNFYNITNNTNNFNDSYFTNQNPQHKIYNNNFSTIDQRNNYKIEKTISNTKKKPNVCKFSNTENFHNKRKNYNEKILQSKSTNKKEIYLLSNKSKIKDNSPERINKLLINSTTEQEEKKNNLKNQFFNLNETYNNPTNINNKHFSKKKLNILSLLNSTVSGNITKKDYQSKIKNISNINKQFNNIENNNKNNINIQKTLNKNKEIHENFDLVENDYIIQTDGINYENLNKPEIKKFFPDYSKKISHIKNNLIYEQPENNFFNNNTFNFEKKNLINNKIIDISTINALPQDSEDKNYKTNLLNINYKNNFTTALNVRRETSGYNLPNKNNSNKKIICNSNNFYKKINYKEKVQKKNTGNNINYITNHQKENENKLDNFTLVNPLYSNITSLTEKYLNKNHNNFSCDRNKNNYEDDAFMSKKKYINNPDEEIDDHGDLVDFSVINQSNFKNYKNEILINNNVGCSSRKPIERREFSKFFMQKKIQENLGKNNSPGNDFSANFKSENFSKKKTELIQPNNFLGNENDYENLFGNHTTRNANIIRKNMKKKK